ncbi:hypothetical protein ACFVHQ_19365 [Actinomycetes bacterium NPDC127524]
MNRFVKQDDSNKEQNHYKAGEAVYGVKAVFPSKTGGDITGEIVYRRKADYSYDPYRKKA